jgi:hypothetical protein
LHQQQQLTQTTLSTKQLGDESVDVFFDKSTMDTLMHDTDTGPEKVSEMVSHVARVLKSNGAHFIVSQLDLDVEEDMDFFQNVILNSLAGFGCNWQINVHRSSVEATGDEQTGNTKRMKVKSSSEYEDAESDEGEQRPRGLQVYVLRKMATHTMSLRRGRRARAGQVTLKIHDHNDEEEVDVE